ncbi:MAG: hypothetical protein JXL20_04430 [Deltaproteobacteria bacterium]|nr:hypothetical protein [Deltaproteobacteria bacterium]MBN2783804.1 hypothetical protein [Pontiellaceae bacterium]
MKKNLGIAGLLILGSLILLYVFTLGAIWNNHSVNMYMLLSVGIMNFSLALLAMALTGRS